MTNKVFYNPEGYVEIVIIGDQTYVSFIDVKADTDFILEKLQKDGKRPLVLIDISHQGKFSAGSNKAGMEGLESTNYDGVAIFGAGNRALEEVTQAIILAMGKTTNTKLFPDRQAAVTWLLGLNDSRSAL
jgi:hypothetical protein